MALYKARGTLRESTSGCGVFEVCCLLGDGRITLRELATVDHTSPKHYILLHFKLTYKDSTFQYFTFEHK